MASGGWGSLQLSASGSKSGFATGAHKLTKIQTGRQSAPRRVALTVHSFQANAQETDKPLTVRFSTHFQAEFGEKLKVVGSTPQLGAWDVGSAPDMQWTDGHVWVTEMDLPKDADFEFKVVHVSGSRVLWEASNNRRFIPSPDVAPSAAEALAVTVVFNNPELTTIEPIHIEEGEIPASTPEWNPTELGLPEDITAGLTAAVKEQEAAVSMSSLPLVLDPIHVEPQEVTLPEAPSLPTSREAEPTQEEAAMPEVAVAAIVEAPVAAPAPEAVKPVQESVTPPAAKALGAAAMLGVAGIIATTLAVDITDAALMGAILTAGATLTGDKQGREDAKKAASTALNVGLNVTENVARKFGLKSHAERRAEAEAEAAATTQALQAKIPAPAEAPKDEGEKA